MKTQKQLKLETKRMLYIANFQQDYDTQIVISESSYMLFYHLFGRSFSTKIFGKFQTIQKFPKNFIDILLEIESKLKRTVVPFTKYQKQYQQIKKRTLKSTRNILSTLNGIQGNPHYLRRLRNILRRTGLNEYYKYLQKRGLKYQVS